jgi:serine/threonine protein kinase
MREAGSIVDGKYKVVKSLGRGGMGEVYLARHLHLEELRVIKILRQDLAADETAQKRFLREARLATQIKHPNVAILYDFARLPEGSFYMVWEHIEGQHVGEWLAEKGHIPLRPALDLGIQTLRGLEAIHASGVVHRDISPDNLMITQDRRGRYLVKIIDLGLAKNLVADPNFEVTQVGTFMGKLKYCSPEQAEAHNGETVDARSDLYSFGLVLYEMICGRPPFEADNPHAVVMKRLSETPVSLSTRNPEVHIPAELDRVLDQALAREPDDRFPDAVRFIEALEPVVFALHAEEGETDGPVAEIGTPRQRSSHQPTEIPPTVAASVPETKPGREESTSHLSKAERDELLAQIDRAAKKKTETTQVLRRAEELIEKGELAEARRLVEKVESSAPRARGLDRVRRRLQEAGASAPAETAVPAAPAPSAPPPTAADEVAPDEVAPEDVALEETAPEDRERSAAPETPAEAPPPPERIQELEGMIETYIRKRQLQLAELALETLVDVQPVHIKRAEYEQWIGILRDELELDQRARETLEAGREALREGDFKTARKRLAELRKQDRGGELEPEFRTELETAERRERQTSDLEKHRDRFEELLGTRRLSAAAEEVQRLADLGASRVTLDLLRGRLDEARSAAQADQRLEGLEKRYAERLGAEDWSGARRVVHEVGRAAPDSARPAEMYAEISRLEGEARRRQAVEQGTEQVEQLLEAGQAEKAELALQILLRLDPQHKRRKHFEKRIRALRG